MKKILIVLLLAPYLLFAQTASKAFTIEGKLDKYPDGASVKLYKSGESIEIASASVLKEKFTLKGKMDEPFLCFLVIDQEKPVEVYVEAGKISFKGDKDKPGQFDISGSSSHKDFTDFTSVFVPVAKELNTLASTINYTMPGPARDSLMDLYTGVQTRLQAEIDKYVAKKPKSLVTPFLLSATYGFNEDVMMLEKRYQLLDASVKKSEIGKQLATFIAQNKIGAVGTEAIDFSQPDTTGSMVSLSSFRGKYVLLDFWASWCGPCRQENPNVVENYNKFKDKNFTVLGVSLDRPGQKEKWLQAIHDDNLTWTHVSDLQFWNNAAAMLYNVKGIPQNFLIGPDGKIVARNLRGPALEEKLCEIFGCN
ncbi:MAG TPA: TlpA disulfide reductase family protein [Chitinophagaceae bacterium]|nr:TlpA disulfide reductase family protein [Chitinophagaceae bacterium]